MATEKCGNTSCSEEETGSPKSSVDEVKVVVLSVIIVLTVLGNASVVAAILLRKGKVSRMYFFILHLSIADLITAFGTLVPELVWTFTFPRFFGNALLCKLVKYVQVVGPYLSSYTLAMTAVDRYQAICYPLSHCRWPLQRSYVMLGLAWLVSLVFSLPQMLVYSGKIDGYCAPEWPAFWNAKTYVTFYSLANFFAPLAILIFCYGKMCDALWTNFKHKKQQQIRLAVNVDSSETLAVGRCQWMRRLWPRSKKRSDGSEAGGNTLDAPDPQTLLLNSRARRNDDDAIEVDNNNENHVNPRREVAAASDRCYLRTHGTTTISNAKIKTVKLTVVVVLGYIVCSAPYVCVHLYTVWGHPTSELLSNIKWLFWLFTLNSCLNPWIYMGFNPELMQTFCGSTRVPQPTRATMRSRFAPADPSCSSAARRRNRQTEAIELRHNGRWRNELDNSVNEL